MALAAVRSTISSENRQKRAVAAVWGIICVSIQKKLLWLGLEADLGSRNASIVAVAAVWGIICV